MADNYLIFMDVSGDITTEAAAEYDIHFLPMQYSIGGEMRTCTGPESMDVIKQFYDGQRHGDLTKTSQITPYQYEEYAAPWLEQGYSILCLCLSSGLSSTYQSACLAQASLKEKYPDVDFMPVDTLAGTAGMGVLAERAGRNHAAGMTLAENFADLNAIVPHIRHWFMVQDLMYLKRGGRVSAATAIVGTALNIRPILMIDSVGKLTTYAKKRGNAAAAQQLYDDFAATYDPASGDVIYIVDSDTGELPDKLKAQIEAAYPNAVVRRRPLSPIIGAHTGPGMIALIHMAKEPWSK